MTRSVLYWFIYRFSLDYLIYDIILVENGDMRSILDDLGSLIAELKSKNENISIFACELAPNLNNDLDSKITQYNEKLREWCTDNGITFIRTNLSFRLGTGDFDDNCFSFDDRYSRSVMNRHGVLRLLAAIHKERSILKSDGNKIHSK